MIRDSLAFDVATAQAAGPTAGRYNAKKQKPGDVKPDFTFENWRDVSFTMFRRNPS